MKAEFWSRSAQQDKSVLLMLFRKAKQFNVEFLHIQEFNLTNTEKKGYYRVSNYQHAVY
jgi:hypothetical protein